MVRGKALKGQTGRMILATGRLPKGTLLLSDLGFADVRNKSGVGSATSDKKVASLLQAQLTVYSEADFGGIFVFLAVVFPPAYRAKREGARCFQRSVAATWAAKANVGSVCLHGFSTRMDELKQQRVYSKNGSEPSWRLFRFRLRIEDVHVQAPYQALSAEFRTASAVPQKLDEFRGRWFRNGNHDPIHGGKTECGTLEKLTLSAIQRSMAESIKVYIRP